MQINLDKKIIHEWIKRNHMHSQCQICEGNEFDINDRFFTLHELNTGILQVGKQLMTIVLIPMICRNCKNILLFEAAAIMFQIEQNKKDALITKNLTDPGVPIQ